LGIGLAVNNSLAVFEALTGRENNFRRTPKFRLERDGDSWDKKRYALPFSWDVILELGFAAYALAGLLIAWRNGLGWTLPFLLLYAAGFGYTALVTLWHSRGRFQVSDFKWRIERI
jgi:hypothetical protein